MTEFSRPNRLKTIAEMYLATDPEAQETGMAANVVRLFIHDDALLPEPVNPSEEEKNSYKANIDANKRAKDMPTSIERSTSYSTYRGENEDEIVIVIDKQAVDLGYKIPILDFSGFEDPEKGIEAAAQYMSNVLSARRDRSAQQKQAGEFNAAPRRTLLEKKQIAIKINPGLIAQGLMEVVRTNLMTNEQKIEQVSNEDSNSSFWFALEFNLLTTLQERMSDLDDKHPLKSRLQKIVQHYGE